jgi:Tol biopolymer transport system component
MHKQYILLLCLWVGTMLSVTAQNYPSLEEFGKNRIQYRNFNWKIIRTANFEIYFYQDGNTLANLTAQYAESEFDRITELLGYTPYNRIKIFLYNSPQELAQSNIGISVVGELDSREIDLAKSRLEIAFTGDQISFKKRLIHDVSMLFVYDMLYGGSLKDALQSSLLLTLPDWFMPGIAAYISEGYSVELDDYMRDASVSRSIRKPSLLQGREAERVGHSIWNYIAQKYGRDNISNILNLTRIIRNEQSSIQSTLGVPYGRFLREWREYYANMAKATPSAGGSDEATITIRGAGIDQKLNDVKISPDKSMIAFSSVNDGKFNVEIYNTATKKRYSVLQGGYRLDGHATFTSTPLVAWQRDNNLVVVTDENGKSYLYIYTDLDKRPKQRSRQTINGLTQIVSVDASDDGGSLVMSADRHGQNDIFLYSINRGNYAQLTNDLYDDLHPVFVGRSTRDIVFASNRTADTLGVDKGTYRSVRDRFSLFRHEGGPRATSVTRLTDTLTNAIRPIAASNNTIYFLGTASGIQNLYRLSVGDSTAASVVSQVTAFPSSIRQYDLIPANGGFVYSALRNGEVYMGYRSQLPLNTAQTMAPTQRNVLLGITNMPKPAPVQPTITDTSQASATSPATSTMATVVPGKLVLQPGEVDTDNYQFDPEVVKAAEFRQRRSLGFPSASTSSPILRNRRRENITIRGPFDYRGLFIANDASSSLRIDPIRGFGFSQNITMNDLLENHIIKAGLFITTTLRNSDLFAEYHNLTSRIDYGVRVDRQTLYFDNESLNQKYRFNRVMLSASYPISVTTRFTVSPFYALTRRIELSSIGEPDRTSDYAGLRGEFVYDNSKINGMNMIEGTRAKVKFENYTGIRSSAQSFRRLTLDLRHYQKIHRDLMLAIRLSVSQSGGPAPKQSTLGGMENWIAPQKESVPTNPLLIPNTTVQGRDDYRDVFFLDYVTNLRGFNLGKLTGYSHMLLNAELRLPLVKYLYRGNITSNFLRNLQLVAFSDVGTAWSGKGPFNRQNNLNTTIVGGGNLPFLATVTNFKNPFLIGYGVGARTMIVGYYVKFDYAWGLEDKVVNKAIPYLTLGYDF